jgi:hypothetical protein
MSIGTEANQGKRTNADLCIRDCSALAQEIWGILQKLDGMKQREAHHAYQEMFNNTPTYALNPDGSAGAADAVPDPTHPMEGQTVSANDLQGFTGYVVNDLYNFLTGVPGPTVADRRPAIAGMLP